MSKDVESDSEEERRIDMELLFNLFRPRRASVVFEESGNAVDGGLAPTVRNQIGSARVRATLRFLEGSSQTFSGLHGYQGGANETGFRRQ